MEGILDELFYEFRKRLLEWYSKSYPELRFEIEDDEKMRKEILKSFGKLLGKMTFENTENREPELFGLRTRRRK